MRHPYRLHLGWRDTATELRTERPELRNALAHIYRPFVTDESVGRDSEATVLPSVNCWRASLNGQDYKYADFEDAVVALEYEIERKLLANPRHGPVLHAAAVTNGSQTVIIAGPSGAGKTTISLECVRRGFRYVTDEFVALDPTGVVLHPFPRAATLKCKWPHVPFGDIYELHADGGYRGFFVPDRCSGLQRIPLPLPQIIFLNRRTNSRPRARSITSHETLAGLICATFQFIGREAIVWPAISALAVRSKACKFDYSDFDADLDVALELLEGP